MRRIHIVAAVLLALAATLFCLRRNQAVVTIPGAEVQFPYLNDMQWDAATRTLTRTGSDPYGWVEVPVEASPLRRVTFEFGGEYAEAEGSFYMFQSPFDRERLNPSLVETQVTHRPGVVLVTAQLDNSKVLRIDLPDFLPQALELRRIVIETSFVSPWSWVFRLMVLSAAGAGLVFLWAVMRAQRRTSGGELPCAPAPAGPGGDRAVAVWFAMAAAVHLAALMLNWGSPYLAGHEFRQAQTALSAHFIQVEGNFSLAYPTPVLGKPWSVPFEFPLYQWTVVGLSNATGYPLVQSGRLASAGCLYLALGALWLLLGRIGLARPGRWIVLGLVLTCPLYAFYGRAFLIETMALMFALWFLHGFVAAVERRSLGWAAVAAVAGIGVGLVKVTTLIIFLVPTGVWTLWWLWGARSDRGAQARLVGWAAGVLAAPGAATLWWLHFADTTKAANGCAQGFRSGALMTWHFGIVDDRFNPACWQHYWTHVSQGILPPFALVPLVVAAVLAPYRLRAWALGALALFVATPVVFPRLYEAHDYYFMATAVLLLAAVGLMLAAAREYRRTRGAALAVLFALLLAQVSMYRSSYLPSQRETDNAGRKLAATLREITGPDDVLVITARDWNSAVPFYSRRRALMLRAGTDSEPVMIGRALDALKGERIGALVLGGNRPGNTALLLRMVQGYDFDERPVVQREDFAVYVPRLARAGVLARLGGEVDAAPRPETPAP
jgi:hypothetical protein